VNALDVGYVGASAGIVQAAILPDGLALKIKEGVNWRFRLMVSAMREGLISDAQFLQRSGGQRVVGACG